MNENHRINTPPKEIKEKSVLTLKEKDFKLNKDNRKIITKPEK